MAAQDASVVDELTAVADSLGRLARSGGDAERIDRIAVLDRIEAAAAAARAVEIADFADSQLADQAACGVPARRRGRGIAEQIAFARKISPTTAAKHLSFARTLTRDLPQTHALLAAGQISEWVAKLVVREVTCLAPIDRRRVDADLAADLPTMNPHQGEAAARRHALALDPGAGLRRRRTAHTDRNVSVRPAPDTMALLTGFLPAEGGIAAWVALDRHARTLKSAGDQRTLGQLRADTMIERLTGQVTAAAVPVEIGITMTVDSLLAKDDNPAMLAGYGPIPADLARAIATGSDDGGGYGDGSTGTGHRTNGRTDEDIERAAVFVRRIFTDPADDTVTAIDTKRRRFSGHAARVILTRDQHCRDPYCTAPIRHLDHRTPTRDGGPTSIDNGEGRCERGNYVKEMPRWRHSTDPGTGRSTITTPTGHTYTTGPPPALGPASNYHHIAHRRALRRLDYLKREQLIIQLPKPP